MKDGLGNEIHVGSKVVWAGGATRNAGIVVCEVLKLNPKTARIAQTTQFGRLVKNVEYRCLVVVDKILPS